MIVEKRNYRRQNENKEKRNNQSNVQRKENEQYIKD